MPDRRLVARVVTVVTCLVAVLAGCSTEKSAATTAPRVVEDSDLVNLLVAAGDIGTVMGVSTLTPRPVTDVMNDDRHLLTNMNCLGVWQPDQAAIYGDRGTDGGWRAMRQQVLREPDTDDWSTSVAQSVVSYPSADAARRFFEQSAERWTNCTNHHVNITLNDKPLPKWLSGDLSRTDNQLAMPIARGDGAQSRVCQHVLTVRSNVVIDVEACRPPIPVITQASAISAKIESAIAV
ncbi:sensor domain-containing protein [Mycolicibacterium sediminis]|uniref:PknH-like extracellular domain-containing protein n=1 Tax=Mycolicibacterium sediminis TaxID=1286180 RepID=A0A7I7QSM9_9MYCO|nr:sensor domain-containing protein [Mycolicibacterium sediminis]BBY29070.1 hypothetical protein MSEDJ_31660 [Mycolicibacterium sediminis]